MAKLGPPIAAIAATTNRPRSRKERAYAHRRFSYRRNKRTSEEDDDEQGVGSEHCLSTSSDVSDAKT
jgi:hypothetical protein